MRKASIVASCLAVVLQVACQAPGESADAELGAETMTASDVATETQAIRAVNTQWLAAVQSHDAAATAAFFTPDGRLLPPNAPTVQGSAAIAEEYAGMYQLPNLAVSWTQEIIEVAETGTLAYDIGTYTLSYDGPAGRIEDNGKYLVIWRKMDGQWRVAAESFNSNLPAQ